MKKQRKSLRRIDTPHGRAYALEGGEKVKFLPSVTSILSLKSSAYLTELEEKMSKEDLQRISGRAALRGTAMHKFLENYLICLRKKGNVDSCLLYTQRKSTDSLLEEMDKERVDVGRSLFYNIFHSGVLDSIKKIIFTEQFLYSETWLFAGTTDFGFLDMENRIVICDFKSSSSLRPEDVVHKYKIQTAAYSIAFEEMFGSKVHRGEIWIANPDGLQIEITQGEEMEIHKQEFLDLCSTYHSMWDTEPFEQYYIQNNI